MDQKLRTFALVTAFFDKNQSIIGTFVPMIVRVVSRDRSASIESIQERVYKTYLVDVPTHVLNTMLNHARKDGYVETQGRPPMWSLAEKGERYSDGLETEDGVTRRLAALIEDACRYFDTAGQPKSNKEMYDILCGIAQDNTAVLEQYLRPNEVGNVHYGDGERERMLLLGVHPFR
ncbi:MAG: hypothetical protein IPH09_02945 [bacterium]|nr:hypothetical protein [bacterium]